MATSVVTVTGTTESTIARYKGHVNNDQTVTDLYLALDDNGSPHGPQGQVVANYAPFTYTPGDDEVYVFDYIFPLTPAGWGTPDPSTVVRFGQFFSTAPNFGGFSPLVVLNVSGSDLLWGDFSGDPAGRTFQFKAISDSAIQVIKEVGADNHTKYLTNSIIGILQ